MGYKMALSFKNNKRDNDLVDIIKIQRDKSNFIKDAVEFYIKYSNSNLQENLNSSNELPIQNEKKENVKAALQFMSLDDD